MDECFYTLELGEKCGKRLEALAARAGYEDVERFAAMVLCHALCAVEAGYEESEQVAADRPRWNPDSDDDLDDEIPF